ncbi:hypothetical protein ASE51_24895 [Bacillus sp. Root147]|nr:hypothetical protein ASE51_24895 [Bacillus sp. Root147]
MDQSEKLLTGIENILSVPSDFADEVALLKSVRLRIKEKYFKETEYTAYDRSCSQFQNLYEEPSQKLIRTSYL